MVNHLVAVYWYWSTTTSHHRSTIVVDYYPYYHYTLSTIIDESLTMWIYHAIAGFMSIEWHLFTCSDLPCRPPLCRFAMVHPGASTRCPWVQWTLARLCLFVQLVTGVIQQSIRGIPLNLGALACEDTRTLEVTGLILQVVSQCFTYFRAASWLC